MRKSNSKAQEARGMKSTRYEMHKSMLGSKHLKQVGRGAREQVEFKARAVR